MSKSKDLEISIIVAMSKNNVIGVDGDLPWHLPNDLKRFKELTTGNIIIMGRKTYESIGKALPNRLNIVLTRNKEFKAENCVLVNSLSAIRGIIDDVIKYQKENDLAVCKVFIIGGESVYSSFLKYTTKLYITHVDTEIEGDAHFTDVGPGGWEDWKEVLREDNKADDKHKYNYSFVDYERLD